MSKNPLNLGLRFLLELTGMFAAGYWGWTQHQGILRFVLAAGAPFLFALLWATFSTPGDRPHAPVPVPGALRLLLEALLFGAAVYAFYASGRPTWAAVFAAVLLIHYALSYDRILWMIRH